MTTLGGEGPACDELDLAHRHLCHVIRVAQRGETLGRSLCDIATRLARYSVELLSAGPLHEIVQATPWRLGRIEEHARRVGCAAETARGLAEVALRSGLDDDGVEVLDRLEIHVADLRSDELHLIAASGEDVREMVFGEAPEPSGQRSWLERLLRGARGSPAR